MMWYPNNGGGGWTPISPPPLRTRLCTTFYQYDIHIVVSCKNVSYDNQLHLVQCGGWICAVSVKSGHCALRSCDLNDWQVASVHSAPGAQWYFLVPCPRVIHRQVYQSWQCTQLRRIDYCVTLNALPARLFSGDYSVINFLIVTASISEKFCILDRLLTLILNINAIQHWHQSFAIQCFCIHRSSTMLYDFHIRVFCHIAIQVLYVNAQILTFRANGGWYLHVIVSLCIFPRSMNPRLHWLNLPGSACNID